MRHIVLVSEAKRFGGAEVYLQRLAQSFSRWEAEIALPDRQTLAVWRTALEDSGVAVRPYAPTAAGWMGLVRGLRAAAPDLVHLNLPNTYDGASGLSALALRVGTGRPVVTTEHLTQLPRSRRRRLTKLLTGPAVSAIVTVSRAGRDALLAEGLPEAKVMVIPNGVPDRGSPVPPPSGGGPLRVGVLGSLEPRKQVDLLVQVAAALEDVPLRIEIGGEGPLRPALERLADRLGQGSRVSFAGAVADSHAFLSRQDLVALPSRLEGMPLVVLEAFAAGRPAVVSRLAGLDEVVEEGRTGRLLPLSDVDAWSAAIRDLAGDRPRLERWGRDARMVYEERFTLERAVRETEAVYDAVLAASIGNRS